MQLISKLFCDDTYYTTEGDDFGAIDSSKVTFIVGNHVSSLIIPIISSNSTENSEEFTVTLDKVNLLNRSIMLNLSEDERARIILNPGTAVGPRHRPRVNLHT